MAQTLPCSTVMFRIRGIRKWQWALPTVILLALAGSPACVSVGQSPSSSRPTSSTPDGTHSLHEEYVGGVNLYNRGDFAGAILALTKVWRQDPDYRDTATHLSQSYTYSGLQYYSQDNYESAIAMWKEALVINPGNVKAERYLVRAERELLALKNSE